MKDIADKLSEILVTPLGRINKPALTYAIEQAMWAIEDLRSENAKLRALGEIPPGMRAP